jgi:hypothetical protein
MNAGIRSGGRFQLHRVCVYAVVSMHAPHPEAKKNDLNGKMWIHLTVRLWIGKLTKMMIWTSWSSFTILNNLL